MKPIPVLAIPHYNRPDLLHRCLASIDYPVTKLVIVDNNPNDDCEQDDLRTVLGMWQENGLAGTTKGQWVFSDRSRDLIKQIIFINHPNAGVAGAWNEVIKLFPAPWWLISNNDIQFAPGDLERMSDAVDDSLTLRIGEGVFYGNHGASFFGLTADAVALAGLFDENIYPAYLEDCDYAVRCDRLGVKRVNVAGCVAVHGSVAHGDAPALTGSCTVNSDPVLQLKCARTHGGNHEYYRAKWGGPNGEEKFSTPFNDPNWPIDFWRYDPARRARQNW